MTYASNTYNSRNFLLRLSHRGRFHMAARLSYGAILDYGCGDAHFSQIKPNVTNYEPHPGNAPNAPHLKTLDGLEGQFDCITCLEVLEHVLDADVERFFSDARRLLKPGGSVVISVPNMLGPPGFLKMMLYWWGLQQLPGHTIKGAFLHLIGRLPPRIDVYHGGYHHAGFDYRVLAERLKAVFRSVEQKATPFAFLPSWLNSQVFFVCRF